MTKLRSFREYHLEKLSESNSAEIHLQVALEEYEKDRDRVGLLLALKDLADAQGGIAKLAEKTKLSRQSLYKSLSEKGNPKLETLETILNGLGFRLSVVPLNEESEKRGKAKKLQKSSSK